MNLALGLTKWGKCFGIWSIYVALYPHPQVSRFLIKLWPNACFFRALTKHPFNYPPQLRKANVRGLYHSYLLKKINAFRAARVAEQKHNYYWKKPRTVI